MRRIIFLPIFVFSIGFSYPPSPQDTVGRLQKGTLQMFEKSFKPSEFDTDIELFHRQDHEQQRPPVPAETLTVAAPETTQGFRIQVLATDKYDEALGVRNDLNAGLPKTWVYMVYDAPVYKIRVGDYATRVEANNALDFFVAKGFREAWVVPDRIIINPPPKPPVGIPEGNK